MDTRSLEIFSPLTTATWRLWRPAGSRTKTALPSAPEVPKVILDVVEDRPVTVRVQTLVVASPLARHTLVGMRLTTVTIQPSLGRAPQAP